MAVPSMSGFLTTDWERQGFAPSNLGEKCALEMLGRFSPSPRSVPAYPGKGEIVQVRVEHCNLHLIKERMGRGDDKGMLPASRTATYRAKIRPMQYLGALMRETQQVVYPAKLFSFSYTSLLTCYHPTIYHH